MPLRRCKLNGKPGYKWGSRGKCYTYTPGDPASRARAKKKALAQAKAMGELK